MRSIESEGDTIDQAIERTLRALDVTREQVQIEILTDATRGLFGFGGRKARVRATVRPPLVSRLEGMKAAPSAMGSRETPPGAAHAQPDERQGATRGASCPAERPGHFDPEPWRRALPEGDHPARRADAEVLPPEARGELSRGLIRYPAPWVGGHDARGGPLRDRCGAEARRRRGR